MTSQALRPHLHDVIVPAHRALAHDTRTGGRVSSRCLSQITPACRNLEMRGFVERAIARSSSVQSQTDILISIQYQLCDPAMLFWIDRLTDTGLDHPVSEQASLPGVGPPGAIGIPDPNDHARSSNHLLQSQTAELVPWTCEHSVLSKAVPSISKNSVVLKTNASPEALAGGRMTSRAPSIPRRRRMHAGSSRSPRSGHAFPGSCDRLQSSR